MNKVIIERWNEVVAPGDTVYHLGDVALGKIAESLALVSHLNGHKILVAGNHDRIFSSQPGRYIERYWPEYLKVFDEYWGEGLTKNIGKHRVNLSHFPYDGDSHGVDRYADKRLHDNGIPLIHGHTHGGYTESFSNNRTPQFNVGVDGNDFRPVSETIIIEWLDRMAAPEPAVNVSDEQLDYAEVVQEIRKATGAASL